MGEREPSQEEERISLQFIKINIAILGFIKTKPHLTVKI
jgi:hypothetical protein